MTALIPEAPDTAATAAHGILYTVVSAVCYALSPVLVKTQFQYGLNASTVLTYRSAVAVLITLAILLIGRTSPRISRQDLGKFIYIGFFAATAVLLLNEAYSYIAAGLTTALHYTFPMFVNVISAVVFKIAFTKARLTSLILSLIGVFILAFNTTQSAQFTGVLLAVLSGFVYAIYMILLENHPFQVKKHMVISLYLNLAVVVYSLIYNLAAHKLTFTIEPMSYVYLVLLAVLNAVVALILLRKGILLLGASKAAIISTVEPVFSVLFGVTLLGEPLTVMLAAGLVFIMAGLLVANIQYVRRRS